jgi:hypothetical protein
MLGKQSVLHIMVQCRRQSRGYGVATDIGEGEENPYNRHDIEETE